MRFKISRNIQVKNKNKELMLTTEQKAQTQYLTNQNAQTEHPMARLGRTLTIMLSSTDSAAK